MRSVYVLHIAAGSVGLIAGYIALYSTKGAPLHRRSGMAFVYAMLAMCFFGGLIAMIRGVEPALNVPAALLSAYLVITSLTTIRARPDALAWARALGSRPAAIGLMLVALAVGLVMLTFGLEAVANGGTRHGMPAFPFFMFATIGLLGSAGDIRVLRSGARTGASRLARHLWRMSFALFIAALSFFIGQAKVIPKPVRIFPLLALPVLAVLVTMLYWLWRVRRRRSRWQLTGAPAPEAA